MLEVLHDEALVAGVVRVRQVDVDVASPCGGLPDHDLVGDGEFPVRAEED